MMDAATLAFVVALTAIPCRHPAVPDRYDALLHAAVERHMPAYAQPYKCWVKAQFWAESKLDPGARSHAGAMGLAQVMPATWREWAARLGLTCSPWDAECAIAVGVAYVAQCLKWTHDSRQSVWANLARQAICYNAGVGNERKARRRARSDDPDALLAALPEVTGRHAAETQTYVARIRRWTLRLLRGAD